MKLTTKGKYGVKALFELAMHEGNSPLSLKTIAERQDLSEHYLEQLVAPLRRAGLVTSVRGAQGGYVLNRPADQITVGNILRVLEGPIGYADCATEAGVQNSCENADSCVAHGVWEQVRDAIVKVVDGITLEDLCRQAREDAERQNIMYHI